MVAVRMDRRLAARVDPSDVVQEALAEAGQHLDEYLRDRPMAFYPWLRHFAWERLVDLHRRHLHARRRSVAREEPRGLGLPDESAAALVDRLVASWTSPSRRLIRAELRERVQSALARLGPRDREVLVLRHLEGLATPEVAAVLGLSPGAVMTRHTRALVRLRALLEADPGESRP
jgi:RNA polymerase sigma-70 factor (ECF subfamily)